MLNFRARTSCAFAVIMFLSFLFAPASHAHIPIGVDAIGFYVKPKIGFYRLNLPESSPLFDADDDDALTKSLPVYDSRETDIVFGGTLGVAYTGFGENLFTEANGFYISDEYSSGSCHYGLTFSEGCNQVNNPFFRTLDDSDSSNLATPINISTKRDVEFYGADLTTGINAGNADGGYLSVSIGPSYLALNTKTNIDAPSSTLTNNETLDASYLGGLFRAKANAPFLNRWELSAGVKFGLYYVDAEYEGSQRSGATTNTRQAEDDDIAFFTGMDISLQSKWAHIFTVKVEGGIEYLSHAPVADYARVGETDPRATTIDFDGASGLYTTISLGVEL